MKLSLIVLIGTCMMACTQGPSPEEMIRELMEVDRAFSQLSEEKGSNVAFETYCAEEGVILRPGSYPVVGKEAVTELIYQRPDTSYQLTWEPLDAKVSESGDMGFTYGIYTLKLRDGSAQSKGTYVSVWIKENSTWRFVLDTGNEGLGTAGSED